MLLSDVITATRDRSAFFHRSRVGNAVIARFLTDYQNDLIVRAAHREPTYCAQAAVIVLALEAANAVGTAGAGTSGGVPASVDADGVVSAVQASAGALVTVGLSESDDASVWVAERAVTSATSTTTTSTGAGRTTDQDVGRLLVITAGKGQGQVREVTANTATVWTHAAWTTIPDTTSLLEIVAPSYRGDETVGVVTDLPAVTTRTGYLVRLSADGTPTIDFTAPLVADVETGVPLPALHTLLKGGLIRYADGTTDPLTVTSYAQRDEAGLAIYQMGESVQFTGDADDWSEVASIEVRYTPIAPAFTALTDPFLVPDAARSAIVANAAAFMALRCAQMPDVALDPSAFIAQAGAAEQTYLQGVALGHRARRTVTRGMD